jgi:hypothetical protein
MSEAYLVWHETKCFKNEDWEMSATFRISEYEIHIINITPYIITLLESGFDFRCYQIF